MATTADNLAVALSLADRGLAVFPCQSGGAKAKQPMPFLKWREASTTDAQQIQRWWQKWPDAAPALDLAKSGLLVVDADRHGEEDGVEAFGQLMAAHNFNPDSAPLVATPNAGNHHFFRQPEGRALGNGRGVLPAGIDVRGAGGYVVAPGAVMQDGRYYELFGDLAEAPVVPAWLVDILEARRGGTEVEGEQSPGPTSAHPPSCSTTSAISSDEIAELLSHIPPDIGYHDWVTVLMAVHAETGGTGLALVDQWSAKGSKYPGAKEMAKKWRSFRRDGVTGRSLAELARSYGADLSAIALKHRGTPHYDPVAAAHASDVLIRNHDGRIADAATGEVADVPTEIDENYGGALDYYDLPDDRMRPGGVVEEIADWICGTTGEPIRIHALGAALVAVGTLLARKVYSKTRPSGTHLYVGAIAPSGFGKDHPQSCVKQILDAVKPPGWKPLHIAWASSAPKLGLEVVEHPACLMLADEFADKFSATRHRNAGPSSAALSEVFKEMWGRSTSSYSLPTAISRSNSSVDRPGLSFYGATTVRDFQESLVSKDVTSGLYNRFLFLPRYGDIPMAPEADGLPKVPERLLARCRWLYKCVDEHNMQLAARHDAYLANPVLVPFTPDAERMNEENRFLQRDMQRRSEDDPALSLYGRYAEQIKRVALIVACGRSPEMLQRAEISVADMRFAKELVRWSIEQSVLMIRRDMVENWIEGNRNKVLGYIRKRRAVKRSEVLRQVRSVKGKDLDEIIRYLREAECIEEFQNPSGGRHPLCYRYLRG